METTTTNTSAPGGVSSRDYKIGSRRFRRGHFRRPSMDDFAFMEEDQTVTQHARPITRPRVILRNWSTVRETRQHRRRLMEFNGAPSLLNQSSSGSDMPTNPFATPRLAQEIPPAPAEAFSGSSTVRQSVGMRSRRRSLSSRSSMGLLVPYLPPSCSPSARRMSKDLSPKSSGAGKKKVGSVSVLKQRLSALWDCWVGADRLKFKNDPSPPVSSPRQATKHQLLSNYLRRSKVTSC